MTRHTPRNTVTANPSVVRLSGPQGLVAAVPLYLGFVPSNSLVLMCLRAPRGRIGPVARVDLFPPQAAEAADQLVGCAARYADSAVVVCYYEGARPGCLDTLLAALEETRVPVTAVLSVRDGMIRDARTAASERADPGIEVPGDDDEQSRTVAAAAVMSGRRVLPSRDALRASIAGPLGRRLTSARAALDERYRALARDLDGRAPAAVQSALSERMDAAFRRARREYGDTGTVTTTTALELIVLADDVTARDLLVARSVGAEDPDVVPMLISVASRCPDEDAPQICSVLAVAAYRYGDGALAQCAVDRVLVREPHHRLAHLMLAAMQGGLPPGELATMADIAE